jgi:integrase/recombinase XerD
MFKPTYSDYQSISNNFFLHLKTLGYKLPTCEMLHRCVQEFLSRQEQQDIFDLNEITSTDIEEHHEYLQHRPNRKKSGTLSEMMIYHHMYALRVFFNWLEHLQAIEENPMSSLEFSQPRHEERTILTQAEIKTLYEACRSLKERAILHLFYGCGLRRNEGVKLKVKDVQFRSKVLYVREGKGSKSRIVPMSETISEDLKAYLYQERKVLYGEQSFIINKRETRMRGDGFNKALKEIQQRSGINKSVSLHSLRHSIATHLLEQGVSIEHVRDFLGHQHLESTQVYTRVSKTQLEAL